MMNQKRSSTLNHFKIAGILPFLAMALLAFAQPVYNTVSATPVSNEVGTNTQEDIMVKGKVVDAETNKSVVSANVIIVNTTSGTITDNNGDFLIKMPAGATLSISYMGYKSVKVLVKDESPLDVRLSPKYYNLKPSDTPAKTKPSTLEKDVKKD